MHSIILCISSYHPNLFILESNKIEGETKNSLNVSDDEDDEDDEDEDELKLLNKSKT